MRKVSSSEESSQSGLKTKPQTAVQECTGVSVIELCESGRYREAQIAVGALEPGDPAFGLALGMVEIYRGNLSSAKDYLTPMALGSDPFSGRARAHLAHAYYLCGEINEAKDLLRDLPDSFEKLLLKGIIEDRPKVALKILEHAYSFKVRPGMAARLHNQRARILRKMGDLDEAIQEYEAALYFFEKDHSDCLPLVVNNIAGVFLDYGEHDRAHQYADNAIALLADDPPHLGKALDQKAQILLAQGDFKTARLKSEQSVRVLRQSDRKEWLVEALLTYARALRAGDDQRELEALREAEAVCRFLDRQDLLIDVLRAKVSHTEIVLNQTECRLLETALIACKGSYRSVAVKLHTSHQQIMRLVKKHKIKRI